MRLNHWSIRYFISKICVVIYEYTHPESPWLTKDAIRFLDHYLKKTDVGLEFGSGRSTSWLGKRIKKLTSVEHDNKWFTLIRARLTRANCKNVDLILEEKKQAYIKVPARFKRNSLDFILIDGKWRDNCANFSVSKLKKGGIFIVDNCERYLPSASKSPESIGTNKTASKEWSRFKNNVKNWRCLWTSNRIFDTAIFIKP